MKVVPVLTALALLGQPAAAGTRLPCRASPDRVGPCRQVHGRISPANGNPTFRIWVVGTYRLLGVLGRDSQETENGAMLPVGVRRAFGDRPFGIQVFADFRVCPLSRERAGWMQFVCVDWARRLHVVRFD